MNDYLSGIYGYPTTVLVDSNGNIIGEPILGSIDDESRLANIMKIVEDAVAKNTAAQATEETNSDDLN